MLVLRQLMPVLPDADFARKVVARSVIAAKCL
jgi:hypothetical protein